MEESPIPRKKLILEEQILVNPFPLIVFLYIIIPMIAVTSIYCALTEKILSAIIASVLLLGYIIVLIIAKKSNDDEVKRKTYRIAFRTQLALFGLFLGYSIGFKGQIELYPWLYPTFFLSFLIFRPLTGLCLSTAFLICVFILNYMLFPLEAFPPNDVIIRFIFSLFNMCALLFVTLLGYESYMNKLLKAQSDLQKSEQKYREQSKELLKEIERRDRVEAQLHSAIKMETVGKLAAGVAHDLNNILSGIVSYPELLLLDLPENSLLRGPIKAIQKSGLLAASIVQDLLTLARSHLAVTEVIDLKQVVKDYLASPEFNNMISYHPEIEIKTDFSPNHSHIKGSFTHLTKVVMNLISNAAEAMPSGGQIHITTEAVHIAGEPAHSDIPDGDYVLMSFRDNGIGIAKEDLEHIFEPFYSKKVMGRSGTGLGMVVVWGTVKDHSGYIKINSMVGEGTTIRIFFPAVSDQLIERSEEESVSEYYGNNEKILVVDDVQQQRELATDILERLGYQTDECENGEDAVEYLKKNDVDLVVLDMVMPPGIDGLETYLRMHAIKPKQKVIFVSGYSNPNKIKDAQEMGAGSFLRKPYALINLGKAVKSELLK